MAICPEGHTSATEDYCDVCGSPVTCPVCHTPVTGRFCDECGHDSAVADPAPATTPGTVWTAVVTADRNFYDRVLARGGPDTVEFPDYFPERRITLRDKVLIGRSNRKQGIEPEIDLGIQPIDRGVSTQHAMLRIRDSGLTITDLGSTNGTSLNDTDELLANGREIPLNDGDRIHVGAWTTITVMKSGRKVR